MVPVTVLIAEGHALMAADGVGVKCQHPVAVERVGGVLRLCASPVREAAGLWLDLPISSSPVCVEVADGASAYAAPA